MDLHTVPYTRESYQVRVHVSICTGKSRSGSIHSSIHGRIMYSMTRYGQIGRLTRDEPLEAAIKCRYSASKNSRRAYVVYPRVCILEMSTLFGWLPFFPSEAAYSVTRYGQIGRWRRDEPLEAAIKCRYSGSKNSRCAYVVYPQVWILEMSTLFSWLTSFPS